ncbi:MAG: 1-deoxy-D-xylulose-5-phosphate synthase, partial [Firmicutes bacterium]|nr:1-deoxy-D-xylulose-5-phosphate synthase [Bacillota bacterium]
MEYLDKINSPADLKKLKVGELKILSGEIREFLINSVSETGGHLASNLGVVDITIALHYCFDSPKDKFIWDVGHQAYTHKILTGRKDRFSTLRKFKGLSGFPKTEESKYDVFDAGHSSTSISAALGIAAARDLKGDKYNVVAFLGDGSMTGGLVYEALNNVARNHSKLLIVLNDNQMSISENVGAMSKYLSNLRSEPKYNEIKSDVSKLLNNMPAIGKKVNTVLERTKDGIKYALVPNSMFEQMGIKYIGPVDGHNIPELVRILNKIKNIQRPIILHVITKKGKGYKFAEKSPSKFHGIASFDVKTGEVKGKKKADTYSDVFGKTVVKLANKEKRLVVVTAAMPIGCGLDYFSKIYPKRLFDVGIAEEHAVTFSGGLAINGCIPVFAVYSTFLQRSYDQIVHDICLQNLYVVFAIDRAGIVGSDGETHQGIYDL